ncbi:unnamed protein product [Fusarium graminearum]|nr:unnamed protein product [Fusarium graminearum]
MNENARDWYDKSRDNGAGDDRMRCKGVGNWNAAFTVRSQLISGRKRARYSAVLEKENKK